MLHVKKTLSGREKAANADWLAKTKAMPSNLLSTKLVGKAAPFNTFWSARAEEISKKLSPRFVETRTPITKAHQPPAERADADQPAGFAQREAAAQKLIAEKKARVAPAYNKGNPVYFSPDMIDDMKNGLIKRRP